jgi:hypothetical protein
MCGKETKPRIKRNGGEGGIRILIASEISTDIGKSEPSLLSTTKAVAGWRTDGFPSTMGNLLPDICRDSLGTFRKSFRFDKPSRSRAKNRPNASNSFARKSSCVNEILSPPSLEGVLYFSVVRSARGTIAFWPQ